MAEGSDSPCLSPDEIRKCMEMSEKLRSSMESLPGPSVDKEVAFNVLYRTYKKWKVEEPIEPVGEENAGEGPSSVEEPAEQSKKEEPAEQSKKEKPKKHNKLWRLCTYVKNEIKAWRCKESKVSEDALTKSLKKLDTFSLVLMFAVHEMEIKQHIILSENNNGEWTDVSTPTLEDFTACLARVTKETFQNEMSPTPSENDPDYFTFGNY